MKEGGDCIFWIKMNDVGIVVTKSKNKRFFMLVVIVERQLHDDDEIDTYEDIL